MKDSVEESIFYVQAVLNHWLMELLVRKSASSFRGGYYSHGKQFVAQLPIYRINFEDGAQRNTHDSIVAKVHQIENLNQRIKEAQNTAAKRTIQRATEAAQRELSALIDDLYGVKGLQVTETDESN